MRNRRHTLWPLLIVCFAAGQYTGHDMFFRMAWLFAGLLASSFLWTWLTLRNIRLTRQTLARRAQVGNSLGEHFVLQNHSLVPGLWLEVRDHSDLPGHRASQVVPTLGRRGAWRWSTNTACVARGEFRLGPLTLISGDPFGFHQSSRRLRQVTSVLIYPATVELDTFPLRTGEISGGNLLRRRTHYVTTNAAGVRDYAPGDSFNRIHWRSSARRDSLMVKEFEIDPALDIWLFMDFSAESLVEHETLRRANGVGPAISAGALPRSTEEYGVVVTASLARHFIEKEEREVGLVAWAPKRELLQPESGDRQLNRILQVLSVGRSLSRHPLAQMLALETPRLTRGATLIVVTASLDPRWVHELRMLTRRGIRPFCVLIDPASFGGPQSSASLRATLHLARVPFVPVQMDDDLAGALTQRPSRMM